MSTYVTTDVHGAYLALKEALDLVNFQIDEDTLIFLGDVCDGWPDVVESVNLLKSIKNLVFIRGNHDQWALNWLNHKMDLRMQLSWIDQSGQRTIDSINAHDAHESVREFLASSKAYHTMDEMVFVHGGLVPGENIEDSDPEDLMWDRFMVQKAFYDKESPESPYSTIFCGHTPSLSIDGSTKPMHLGNIWNLDTGASYDGPLTIMNVETSEYWQTEPVGSYYPGVRAR